MDPSHFVVLADYVPSIVQEIRYHSTYNFIGDRVDGYEEPVALLTIEAARCLKEVSNQLNVQGYRLKVFDAYRPVRAVRHFILWGVEDLDLRMKPFFYPELDKTELFEKGYIATISSHSRGSTVDLTLLDMETGKEVDMGSPFDLFSEISHPDCQKLTKEQCKFIKSFYKFENIELRDKFRYIFYSIFELKESEKSEQYISKIITTRNYYVHGGKKDNTLNNVDMLCTKYLLMKLPSVVS